MLDRVVLVEVVVQLGHPDLEVQLPHTDMEVQEILHQRHHHKEIPAVLVELIQAIFPVAVVEVVPDCLAQMVQVVLVLEEMVEMVFLQVFLEHQ
jgi:hypothetical protein